MNITFGIVTGYNSPYIEKCIQSIHNLKIPNYEIIIIGQSFNCINNTNIKFIEYKDKHPLGDISIKKNYITKNSKYDIVVYLHDYISFDLNWYNGFLKYGEDFNICMNKIFNFDKTRYRDWTLWMEDGKKILNNNNFLIPYDIVHLSKIMYFSGAYWVGKKQFMLKYPLNNNLNWGQGEDVEWSKRVREITDFKINKHSSVTLLKYKDRIFNETSHEENILLNNLKL